jgi:acyl carrier protein
MAVNTAVPRELAASRDQHLKEGITNEEGAAVLFRALIATDSQLLVSTRDWQTRMAAISTPAPATATQVAASVRHQRPALEVRYVAPRNEAEKTIASVWEEMLGVAPVGIEDDFFALGGHSLLAIQVVARLRERFNVDVPVQMLFDAPTISQLATRVQALADDNGDESALVADMMRYVGQLSDEEVERLLESQGGEQPGT